MAPLVLELRRRSSDFEVRVCLTGQHRQMLDQVNRFFGVVGDYDLNLMTTNQTLAELTARCVTGVDRVLGEWRPDIVFVQGDTTTVMAGALAAYYRKIPIAHLEAGLRSGDLYSPFPEEANRIMTGHLATWHFAPTEGARANLAREGIVDGVHVVGNTVVDALLLGLEKVRQKDVEIASAFAFLDSSKRIVLVTGHRRESFGRPFEELCEALKDLAAARPDVQIVYPVHLNPNVREPVNRILKGISNVYLIEPLDYPQLIWLLDRSYMVLTDSGGIQEEAPTLGKPVLVLRDVTERMEGIEAGTAKLVGTNRGIILAAALELLDDQDEYERMARAVNPYGDGTTSGKIRDILAGVCA